MSTLDIDPDAIRALRDIVAFRRHRPDGTGCLVHPCGFCADNDRLTKLADQLEAVAADIVATAPVDSHDPRSVDLKEQA